jgi:hypothetical protein
MIRINEENIAAEALLPPAKPDSSRIGVNYVDAYVKALNVDLPDGRKSACKRKGLKLTLTIADRSGEALLRRLDHGPDPRRILRAALEEAAAIAGERFLVQDGVMYFAGGAA